MSKRVLTPKQKEGRFWLILAICALSFLILVGVGLIKFWDFMAAFEASRPQNAIDSYMAGVTAQSISQRADVLPDGYDTKAQPEQEARQAIADSLGTISYARNTKLSADSKTVYMVLSGGKTVGSVAMTVVRTDQYGFEYWAVTEESFDFSHLVGKAATVTVPEDYLVYAGDVLLDADYITEKDIPYQSVKDLYEKYDLPTLCTYTVGPVLGELSLSVTDPQGTPVEITPDTDMEQFLRNCPREEAERVEAFLDDFVQRYTDFTSVTGGQGAMNRNYKSLIELMVPDGNLAYRMNEAKVGLLWVTDRGATVSSVTVDRCLRLEEGRWLCDFTYVIDTRDFTGKVQSTTSAQMVLVELEGQLLAESMITK